MKKLILTAEMQQAPNKAIPMRTIGNNGAQVVDFLNRQEWLKDGMTDDQIADMVRPYMINESWLTGDGLWEDVHYRAEELGFQLAY